MNKKNRLKGSSFFWVFQIVLLIAIFYLISTSIVEYKGESYIYLIFTLTSTVLLYCGFRKNALFFDTFIGIFLWLGFWLKLTVHVSFMGSEFEQAVGNFDGTGAAFDHALLVTSCAFSGLILSSWLREKFIFVYPIQIDTIAQQGLFEFYKKYRVFVLLSFVVLITFVAITNIYFGFYQRGSITRNTLPFGLNGIYKWLLLFGLASVSALILRFEFARSKKTSYVAAIVALIECSASNVSLLSRGMILNGSALIYGAFKGRTLYPIKFNVQYTLVILTLFFTLFIGSVLTVNYLRVDAFHETATATATATAKNNTSDRIKIIKSQTAQLIIDRWVGLEGVMAVSSFERLGWELWQDAIQETYSENKLSFYDANLINSPYKKTDMTKHHFISLPGVIAFCFYPGSYIFLFFCMFSVGMVGSFVEIFVFKLGGRNVFLCSLFAQVIAYRFASFGYVPSQSYLLFGALILNVVIIYSANKFLTLNPLRRILRLP